jgi:hypothetical protein
LNVVASSSTDSLLPPVFSYDLCTIPILSMEGQL